MTKKCIKCKSEIDSKATKCPFCGSSQGISSGGMFGALGFIVIVSAIIIFISGNYFNSKPKLYGQATQPAPTFTLPPMTTVTTTADTEAPQTTAPGQPRDLKNNEGVFKDGNYYCRIDDIEMGFDLKNIYTCELDNPYIEHYGENAIVIHAFAKNFSEETKGVNIFWPSFFGSKGVEIDNYLYYFDFGEMLFNDLRPGATTVGYLCFEYDGDGTYYIILNEGFNDDNALEFPVEIKLDETISITEETAVEFAEEKTNELNTKE